STVNMRGQTPGTFLPPPGSNVRTCLTSDAEIVVGDCIALLDRRRTHASGPAQTLLVPGTVDKRVANKTDSDIRSLHGIPARVELQRRAVPLGILVEHLLAVAAAEIDRPPRELGAEPRGRAVDDHSADRVFGVDPDVGRRGLGLRLDHHDGLGWLQA